MPTVDGIIVVKTDFRGGSGFGGGDGRGGTAATRRPFALATTTTNTPQPERGELQTAGGPGEMRGSSSRRVGADAAAQGFEGSGRVVGILGRRGQLVQRRVRLRSKDERRLGRLFTAVTTKGKRAGGTKMRKTRMGVRNKETQSRM